MINHKQYGRLVRKFVQTQNMSHSALSAGVDRKTARKYIKGKQPPEQLQKPHTWRTRRDPLAGIWEEATRMLEAAPELEAKTLFEFFVGRPDNGLQPAYLRTFQRRVRQWRAKHGPDKEVYFPRHHSPGQLMELDWTNADELKVTIQGKPLKHLFCQCVLPYSDWQWAKRCQSESFLSLVGGLQAAFGQLGKKPTHLGTDHSSAATHEVSGLSGKRDYNPDYLDLCMHYDLKPVTINVACPHEHGDVESHNRHIKRRIHQHLLLRGHRDFESEEAYDGFVETVLKSANKPRQARLVEEMAVMKELPSTRLSEYREVDCSVGSHSTIRVKKIAYSVPARLIGQRLRVEVYESRLKVFLGRELVQEMPRACGNQGAVIDFRHVVGPLLRKPGAFARYKFREQLYPTLTFRAAYDRLVADYGEHGGTVEYLHLLKLAAELTPERLEPGLKSRLAEPRTWRTAEIRAEETAEERPVVPEIVLLPDLADYDGLLEQEMEVAHGN